MANIAQTINVLQAMILTRGEDMLLTPSYYVFQMYKVHQDAQLLDFDLFSEDYQMEDEKIPAVNASASVDSEGKINITLCNLKAEDKLKLSCIFNSTESNISNIKGSVLTANELTAHNTFEEKDRVKPENFNDAKLTEDGFEVNLPASSVVLLTLE
ncbi:MAG: alpha-L-arabinofuranosidase C-terminal domain-containing protein, partial [bacterium]